MRGMPLLTDRRTLLAGSCIPSPDRVLDVGRAQRSLMTARGRRSRRYRCHRVSNQEQPFDLVLVSLWSEAAEDARHIDWTRRFHTAMQPWFGRSVYVNSLDQDDAARVPQAYGSNYARLSAIKAKYDPGTDSTAIRILFRRPRLQFPRTSPTSAAIYRRYSSGSPEPTSTKTRFPASERTAQSRCSIRR